MSFDALDLMITSFMTGTSAPHREVVEYQANFETDSDQTAFVEVGAIVDRSVSVVGEIDKAESSSVLVLLKKADASDLFIGRDRIRLGGLESETYVVGKIEEESPSHYVLRCAK